MSLEVPRICKKLSISVKINYRIYYIHIFYICIFSVQFPISLEWLSVRNEKLINSNKLSSLHICICVIRKIPDIRDLRDIHLKIKNCNFSLINIFYISLDFTLKYKCFMPLPVRKK